MSKTCKLICIFHNCPQEQQQSNSKDLGSKCPRSKSAYVIYEWPPSLLDDSDEDDIDAGPAKKSRPSNEGYFAGLPQPVKSRNIDQTSRVKTLRDNEEVTDEDSDIVSYSNTSFCFVILHSWAGLAVLFSRRILNGYSLLKFFRYETIETHALAFLTHIFLAIGGVIADNKTEKK